MLHSSRLTRGTPTGWFPVWTRYIAEQQCGASLEPETAYRPVKIPWWSLACLGARPPASLRATAPSLFWVTGLTVEAVKAPQAAGSAPGPHLLCAAARGPRGPPGRPFSAGSLQSTQGCGPGGSVDGSAAPAWLPRWVPAHLGSYPLCGERGLGSCPQGGVRRTHSRQNGRGPGHATSSLQASVSPSMKWAVTW